MSQSVSQAIQAGNENVITALPPELLIQVVANFPIQEIRRLCQSHPRINEVVCRSQEIWRSLFRRDISSTAVPEDDDYRRAYLDAEHKYLKRDRRGQLYDFVCTNRYSQDFNELAEQGYDKLFHFLVSHCQQLDPTWRIPVPHTYGWNGLFKSALESNNSAILHELIQLFLTDYMDPTSYEHRKAPLHIIVEFHRLDLLKQLLDAGVDPDTFIYWAASQGQIDTLELLKKYGANLRGHADQILEEAAGNGHLNLVDFALGLGATEIDSAIGNAVVGEHVAIIRRLLPLTQPSEFFNEYLNDAAEKGNLEIAKLILPYTEQTPRSLRHSLKDAYCHDNYDVAKYLLSVGADWFPEDEDDENEEENEEEENENENEEEDENEDEENVED